MALNFKKGMEASIGGGMKLVQYEVDNATTAKAATITAKDIGLSTILYLTANQVITTAACTIEFGVGLGTFLDGKGDANYATIAPHHTGGTTRTAPGTFQVFAIGM